MGILQTCCPSSSFPALFIEAELLRKIRIQMRAADMLQMASSPISTRRPRAPRTAARTQEEKLSFLQTEFRFQPRVNSVVPDYEGLYKTFQKRAAERRETQETTRNKPFLLRTANLCHAPRSCDATPAGGGRVRAQASIRVRPEVQQGKPRSQREALVLTLSCLNFYL